VRAFKSFETRCFGLTLIAITAISSLTAQRTGNGGAGTSSPARGTATGPSIVPSQPAQPNPGQFPDTQMPVFLSGRVLMADGTAPATSIAIQRVCSGTPRTMAFTDARGQFNFQWGSPTGFVPDASEVGPMGGMQPGGDPGATGMRGTQTGGGFMGRNMLGCELIADAPGFRSARLDLSGHRAGDNPDLGTIVLHRIAGVEGTFVSASALNAPKEARRSWEKGVFYLHKSKLADAEKELEKAVEIYPKYANAWLDLGRARIQRRETDPARDAFLKAIDADGKLVEPFLELGQMAARAQNWPDAARYLDRALQLDPVDYPRLWFEDAVADYNVQNFERAETNAREALKQLPPNRDPHAQQLLGLILMNKQLKAQIEQVDSHLTGTRP
jgi:Tfp pilus assembly protein PilF